MNIIQKIYKDKKHNKEIDELKKIVNDINNLENDISKLTNEELKEKTNEFKIMLNNGNTLDDILIEAFAVVRESSKRILNMRHFDVQLMGGYVLHTGAIAEMQTGEGKTLTATLTAYLNALQGNVHIVTVNDYLAERDANWMKPLYNFLGLTVGVVKSTDDIESRKKSYACDIVYATNSELVFDYLRNNMALKLSDIYMQELNYAIIDEADCILIDEARSPIKINYPSSKPLDIYYDLVKIADTLVNEEDYTVNLKEYTLNLTDDGVNKIQSILNIENIYDTDNIQNLYKIQSAVYAKELLKKDRDYIVKDNKLILIDQLTGRLMYGRTLGDGYQQCVEAKEGIPLSHENEIKAVTTYQKYFPLYKKISGMTGTAKTEEDELISTYGLHVIQIPTNKPVTRKDLEDVIFKTEKVKNEAIIEDIIEKHIKGQPVLIGTPSVEKSEIISQLLYNKNIKHEVLNAKNHKREAEIIALAGKKDAITIITNMAGRGTDIKLEDGVAELGGLYVIGTTRHDSRRIDNQLRGRAGRQGDPGISKYYVSMEDDLIARFGGESAINTLNKMKFPDDRPIDHPFASKLIEKIQISCENNYFEIRKYIKQYDDIDDTQRNIIYKKRNNILTTSPQLIKQFIFDIYKEVVSEIVDKNYNSKDMKNLVLEINTFLFEEDKFKVDDFINETDSDKIKDIIIERLIFIYERKELHFPKNYVNIIMKNITLNIIDKIWIEHLLNIDYLKKGLGLRALVGQKPLLSYTLDSYNIFEETLNEIKYQIMSNTLQLEIKIEIE